ncbi:MAG: metallophosphatase family protein, partial [Actinobacteria bacterium]|nr:metallophosphatase family protein [Actinomycetota bacterium]
MGRAKTSGDGGPGESGCTVKPSSRDSCVVGIISDTHGVLDPRVIDVFSGVTHIIHAGDVGAAEVLTGLSRIAPVTAVRGNMDSGALAWDLPQQAVVE